MALRTFAEELGQKAIEEGGEAASKFLGIAAKVLMKIAMVLKWLKEWGDKIMTTVVSFIQTIDNNGVVKFVTQIVKKVKESILKILEKIGCGKDRSTDPIPTELRKWGVVILKKLGEAMDHFDMFKTASVWVKTVSSCLSVCEEKDDADEDVKKKIDLIQECAGKIAGQIGKSIDPCWYEPGHGEDADEDDDGEDADEDDGEDEAGTEDGEAAGEDGEAAGEDEDGEAAGTEEEFKEDLDKACTVQDEYFLFEDDQTHGQPNDGVKPVKVVTKDAAGITLAGVSSFVIILFIFI